MNNSTTPSWRVIDRFLFRFFFIYFIFYTAPWTWLDGVPYTEYISRGYNWLLDQIVSFANKNIFKIYKELVPLNGSGDTSWAFIQLRLFLFISFLGAVIWGLVNNKKAYPKLNYLLCTTVRYFLAIIAFGYGIIKIFALQMSFPSISQLATPLGEFLPMRFSWMFIGYSTPYQQFSGVMEVLVGCLLFYRRTATAGVLLAAAVFTNVFAMNLAYDIPVKIFSAHLVAMSFFLMAQEHKRILDFFWRNKEVAKSELYNWEIKKRWQRVTRVVLKIAFVILIIIMPFNQSYKSYKEKNEPKAKVPIASGIYDVKHYVLNKDTIPSIAGDSSRWNQVILEEGTTGSLISADTMFRKIYGRSYFGYFTDTIKKQVVFRRNGWNKSDSLFTLQYFKPDSLTIRLSGKLKKDSVIVVLKKTEKQFRLAEKQFHWLSEYNR